MRITKDTPVSELFHSEDLTHWGIKGMKWGVRRYQNEDGTLTSAGKKRYDYDYKGYRLDDGYMVPVSSPHKDALPDVGSDFSVLMNGWVDTGRKHVQNMPLFDATISDIDFDSIPKTMPSFDYDEWLKENT